MSQEPCAESTLSSPIVRKRTDQKRRSAIPSCAIRSAGVEVNATDRQYPKLCSLVHRSFTLPGLLNCAYCGAELYPARAVKLCPLWGGALPCQSCVQHLCTCRQKEETKRAVSPPAGGSIEMGVTRGGAACRRRQGETEIRLYGLIREAARQSTKHNVSAQRAPHNGVYARHSRRGKHTHMINNRMARAFRLPEREQTSVIMSKAGALGERS
ncbi:hypothetical protein JZ751_013383 [Albula glossodonta]|uniref:Uncharacterized protein n=1 Tax=Albula glossodonta TaxID=121402 RepID=A0A8T2N013_9TELE|nr:hypothetical protein JZ751_013383 [Albula glossodonta]